MGSVNCPSCGLVNPDSAQACDCGYPLKGKPVASVPPIKPIKAIIVGADIPFWDLVWLMVKWALAVIPAMCILASAGFVLWMLLATIGGIGMGIESSSRYFEKRAQNALAETMAACEGGTNEACMNRHGYRWDGYKWAK